MSYLIGKTLPIDLASRWMRLDWLVGSQNVEIWTSGAWRRFCNFRGVPAGGSPDRTFASTTTVKAVTLDDPLHGACPTCVHQNIGGVSGHSLEISDASGRFRHSLTEKSFYERTNKDVTDEVNSVSKSAQFEGRQFCGQSCRRSPSGVRR